MKEAPATQYFFAPACTMYHLAQSESYTICGMYVSGNENQKRRRSDWRLTSEKPERPFEALCGSCERIAKGEPEPTIDWNLMSSHRFAPIPS